MKGNKLDPIGTTSGRVREGEKGVDKVKGVTQPEISLKAHDVTLSELGSTRSGGLLKSDANLAYFKR